MILLRNSMEQLKVSGLNSNRYKLSGVMCAGSVAQPRSRVTNELRKTYATKWVIFLNIPSNYQKETCITVGMK